MKKGNFLYFRKVPKRLPDQPALIREASSDYAIWTGRNWCGNVYALNIHRLWIVRTPSAPDESYESMGGALEAAYSAARRFEGLSA